MAGNAERIATDAEQCCEAQTGNLSNLQKNLGGASGLANLAKLAGLAFGLSFLAGIVDAVVAVFDLPAVFAATVDDVETLSGWADKCAVQAISDTSWSKIGGGLMPETPSQGGSGSNLLTQWLDAVRSALSGAPTELAKALGLLYSARAAISTVASGVAAAVSQATINTANAKYHGVPLSPAVLATAIVRNVLGDSSGGAGISPANYPPPLMSPPRLRHANDEALFRAWTLIVSTPWSAPRA